MSEQHGNQTKAGNTTAIARATGRPWHAWVELLEQATASQLSHPEIAAVARQAMPAEVSNPDWWAQGVAIAYEQHAGIRVPGQSAGGDYRVSASRTVSLDRDVAAEQWQAMLEDAGAGLGHEVRDVRRSRTDKRSFWRASLESAGKVEFAAEAMGDGRARCAVQHTGLADADSIEVWRTHWKARLAQL